MKRKRYSEEKIISILKEHEAVDHRNHDVLGAAGLEFGHHLEPELGAFGLLDPQPQDLLVVRAAHADGEVYRFFPDRALVADLDPEGIEKHDRKLCS